MTAEQIAAGLKRLALVFSSPLVREAIRDLPRSDWRDEGSGSIGRKKPYPMGLHPSDPNLYYAIGWGRHEYLWPWERWVLRLEVRRILQETPDAQ